MINFEEELKKFHPSLEVEDAEEAIYNQDLTDMGGYSGEDDKGIGRKEGTVIRNSHGKEVCKCFVITVAVACRSTIFVRPAERMSLFTRR